MNNTINGRTPEEIKRGLECFECDGCAYSRKNNDGQGKCSDVEIDALAYILQLEAGINRGYEQHVDVLSGLHEKIQQLERERDAAVEDMLSIMGTGLCYVCGNRYLPEDSEKYICTACTTGMILNNITFCGQFRWRGVQEEVKPDEQIQTYDGEPTHWMPLPEPPKEEL